MNERTIFANGLNTFMPLSLDHITGMLEFFLCFNPVNPVNAKIVLQNML